GNFSDGVKDQSHGWHSATGRAGAVGAATQSVCSLAAGFWLDIHAIEAHAGRPQKGERLSFSWSANFDLANLLGVAGRAQRHPHHLYRLAMIWATLEVKHFNSHPAHPPSSRTNVLRRWQLDDSGVNSR